MLDVHPPHQTVHTWKDFFIHIATICVGLLIAVGLEQSVEALHRRHERTELRASLHRELEQLAYDSGNEEADAAVHSAWLKQIEDQIEASMQTVKPLDQFSPPPPGQADDREDPFYRAAKASGRLTLLDEDEIAAFGEIDGLVDQCTAASDKLRSDYAEMVIAERKVQHPLGSGSADQSSSAPLVLLQDRVLRLQTTVNFNRNDARFLYGATEAMLHGERNLKRIEAAEREHPTPTANH